MTVNVMLECEQKDLKNTIKNLEDKGFAHDKNYLPITMRDKGSVIIRGTVDENKIDDLKSVSGVMAVWNDAKIEPF